MKTIFKNKRGGAIALAILSAFCLLASALPALAGQVSQTDTNSLAVSSTNTFILSGDVTGSFTNGELPSGYALINCTQTDDVWLECGGVFTNTTAGASNILFRIAGSVTATQWTNSFITVNVSVPASSTNFASSEVLIQNCPPFLGWRTVENTNGAAVTARAGTLYVKAYVKTGI